MVKPTYGILYGLLLIIVGVVTYLTGVSLGVIRAVFGITIEVRPVIMNIVWYSAAPIVFGLLSIFLEILLNVRKERRKKFIRNKPLDNMMCTAVLTAYNDEASIAESVKDFLSNPHVKRVIVVSNNSTDNTYQAAKDAGAIVFDEKKQGYGSCVWRCLKEGASYDDTDMVVLCEGDMTFRAYDVGKLIQFIRHADIVNGTRIVEKLQDNSTQITTLMHYGNLFVGKLLEAKFLSAATLSDVGTTYKVLRRDAVMKLLPLLDTDVNLEFNPYLLETAIRNNMAVVEVPVTFHPRVGVSKGGNISNIVALRVGMRMIVGILFGWDLIKQKYK